MATSAVLAPLASLRATLVGVRSVSKRRRAVALAIAVAADVLQLVLWPAFAEGAASPFDDALDVVVGAALWATLGMSPRLAFAFAMELVPGADLFPTWSAVVLSIPVQEGALPVEDAAKLEGTPPPRAPRESPSLDGAYPDAAPVEAKP